MSKKTKFIFIVSVICLATPLAVLAHQPRLVERGAIIQIQQAEVSQAFYGELAGSWQDFKIVVEEPFNFYAGILVPDLPMIKTNLSLEIFQLNPATTSLAFLDGAKFNWTALREPFAGDDYFKGPEFEQALVAGQYLIRVASPNLKGKYTLVVGRQESFPPGEIWKTLKVLPTLKSDFFNKAPWTMFFNYIGLMMLAALLVVVVVVFLAWRLIKSLKNR